MQKNTIRKITMNDKRTDHNKNKAENHKLITEITEMTKNIEITKIKQKTKESRKIITEWQEISRNSMKMLRIAKNN